MYYVCKQCTLYIVHSAYIVQTMYRQFHCINDQYKYLQQIFLQRNEIGYTSIQARQFSQAKQELINVRIDLQSSKKHGLQVRTGDSQSTRLIWRVSSIPTLLPHKKRSQSTSQSAQLQSLQLLIQTSQAYPGSPFTQQENYHAYIKQKPP